MAYPGAMDLDAAGNDSDFAAAIDGDSMARWRALAACRDYLRLVIERGRWAKNGASLRASDLVQKTIVDGWDNFSDFHGHTHHQLRAWLTSILIHSSLNARRRPYEVPIESGGRLENVADSASSPSKAVRKSDARAVARGRAGELARSLPACHSIQALGPTLFRPYWRTAQHYRGCRPYAIWASDRKASRIDEAWP